MVDQSVSQCAGSSNRDVELYKGSALTPDQSKKPQYGSERARSSLHSQYLEWQVQIESPSIMRPTPVSYQKGSWQVKQMESAAAGLPILLQDFYPYAHICQCDSTAPTASVNVSLQSLVLHPLSLQRVPGPGLLPSG